ncbi:MAG: LamG domain-containing protein, partial [Planctomycetota bacterium]
MSRRLICLVSSVLVLIAAGTASADLVAHWKLDDGSGTTATDSVGSNHGTFVGNPQWIEGIKVGALDFDGASSVNCGSDTSLDVTGPFSCTIWIRPGTDGNQAVCPLSKAESPNWSWQLRYGWSPAPAGFTNIMGWQFNSAARDWVWVHQELAIGEWYHIAASNDGATVKCYLDGVETDSKPMTGFASSNTTFLIGSDGWNDDWIGAIDDVRLYDHALTEPEILGVIEGEISPQAWGPSPKDGELLPQTWANLSWKPGPFAVTHDVYIGDNFDDVDSGVGDTFVGNMGGTSQVIGFATFPVPDGLVPGTTYYWRIDEVNDADPNSPWKGDIWSFSIPPKTAYSPDPADGAEFV